jgi:hypothetical protein
MHLLPILRWQDLEEQPNISKIPGKVFFNYTIWKFFERQSFGIFAHYSDEIKSIPDILIRL